MPRSGDYLYDIPYEDGKAKIIAIYPSSSIVNIPDTIDGYPVTIIGNGGPVIYYSYSSIPTKIVVPEGVLEISDYAFGSPYASSKLSKLVEVILPNGLTTLGNGVFTDCYKIESITIPDSVTSMGYSMFYNCYALAEVILPSGITEFQNYLLINCLNIETIEIPAGIETIQQPLLDNCPKLSSITVNIANQHYYSDDGVLYSNDGVLVLFPFLKYSVTIPTEITSIGEYSFLARNHLRKINLHYGIESVGIGAFCNTEKLYLITFESADTIINDDGYGITISHPTITPDPVIIRGYNPSTAKDFADLFGIEFSTIGIDPEPILPINLESISITTPATKTTYYVGESLSIQGLIVTGFYDDGSSSVVPVSINDITGFDSSEVAEDQVLTITINDKTATYEIQIIEETIALPQVSMPTWVENVVNKVTVITKVITWKDVANAESYTVKLYNASAQLLDTQTVNKSVQRYDYTDLIENYLPAGSYTVTVQAKPEGVT